MLKSFLAAILFFIFGLSASAQNWDWVVKGGGSLSDKATDVLMDGFGNTYVTGYYNEQAFLVVF